MKKILLIASLLLLGCIAQTNSNTATPTSNEIPFEPPVPGIPGLYDASTACVKTCQTKKDADVNLSSGPCLSNQIYLDFVCDVAHNPRQAVDDLTENQCADFGNTAQHFVEVDENCNIIAVS